MDADNVSTTSTIGVFRSVPPELLQCKARFQRDPTVSDSHWFIIPSFFILLLLGCLEKRRNVCKTFCGGRPGLPRPMSFLYDPRNTWGILFAFGATYTNIMLVICRSFALEYAVWAKIGMVYLLSLETSFICYPLFACMTSRHILVGAITGILYSVAWLSYQIYRLVLIIRCTQRLTDVISSIHLPVERVIITELPAVICSTLVLAKFIWGLINCCRKKRFTRTLSEEASSNICNGSHLQYVKALLKRKVYWNSELRNVSVLKKKYHDFFETVTGFKFPITIMITAFFSVLIVFIITLILAFLASSFTANSSIVEQTQTVAVAIASMLTISSGLRCVFVMLMNYRRDMLCLYRGDRSFIPESLRNMPPQIYVVQSLQFIGFSLVGSFLGSLLAFFALFLPLFLTLLVLSVLDRAGELHSLFPELEWLIFPVSLVLIFKIQVCVVEHIFMQDRINTHDDHRPLAIDNREVYNVFAYLMVFFYACVGLLLVLKRIFISVIYGVFLIARMDCSLLLSGYETMDACYTSYIGMIVMDVSHNHPVMRVFCRMLHDSVASTTSLTEMVTENQTDALIEESSQLGRTTTLAKRRWYLAYTLIRNPDIKKYRVKVTRNVAVRPEDVTLSGYQSHETEIRVSDTHYNRETGQKSRVPPNRVTNFLVGCVLVFWIIWYAGMTVVRNTLTQLFSQLFSQLSKWLIHLFSS